MWQRINYKLRELIKSRYGGQSLMTLGFIFAVCGAGVALIGKYLLALSSVLLVYIFSKFLIILGWIVMVFGTVVMASGILVVWWKLFVSDDTNEK